MNAPSATRHDLQFGRRFFHFANGVTVGTAYALLFTHQQIVHIFGTIACVVYIADRVRIAYPETIARYVPWINRTLLRAEEQVLESAMIPFAIAVLLTMLTVPKLAALVAIYTLAIADPLAAVIGIRFGRHRISHNRSLEGSFAFLLATITITAAVLRWGTNAEWPPIIETGMTVGMVATVCELLPLRVDDNLTIPIFVGFITWAVAAFLSLPLH